MWTQTDGGMCFIVPTCFCPEIMNVTSIKWCYSTRWPTGCRWTCSLRCIYEASPPCGASCGPPACTAPWRASAHGNIPPSGTRTPSSRRGCGRCWCAVRRGTGARQQRGKEATFSRTCTFTPAWVRDFTGIHTRGNPRTTPVVHYAWQLLCICQQDVEATKSRCFFRLCVFLKTEELPQIPATPIRKSIYLPFFFGLEDQDVTVMGGTQLPLWCPKLNACLGQVICMGLASCTFWTLCCIL